MADNAECSVTNLDHQVLAKNIILWSETSLPDQDPTRITISALGAGAPFNNGTVSVEANQAIDLTCGASSLHLNQDTAQSGIFMGTADGGPIAVRAGLTPGTPLLALAGSPSPKAELSVGTMAMGSGLTMTTDKLCLDSGPPGVGASLEMSPTGLTLKFAAWSIQMSATGIELAVGTNKISLQASGISINGVKLDLAALTQMNLEALQIEEKATVQWSASSSAIKML
jgi:hypothetical protein